MHRRKSNAAGTSAIALRLGLPGTLSLAAVALAGAAPRDPLTSLRPVGYIARAVVDAQSGLSVAGAASSRTYRWYYAEGAPLAVFATELRQRAEWRPAGGRPVELTATATAAVPGGARTTFSAPPGSEGELRVGEQRFAIAFVPDRDDWPRVKAAREAPDARSRLKSIAAKPEHPLEALSALHWLARTDEAPDGYQRGQNARAERALREGFGSVAVEAWTAAANDAWRTRELRVADRFIEKARAMLGVGTDDLSSARIALIAGYIDYEVARYRQGEATLRAGLEAARRQGDPTIEAFIAKAIAALHGKSGRHGEAVAGLNAIEKVFSRMPDALRLPYLVDRGYLRARAMAEGAIAEDWPTVHREVSEALELARRVGDADREADQLANLVWVSERSGDFRKAQIYLGQYFALPASEDGLGRRLVELARARLLARQNPSAAVDAFSELYDTAKAESAGLPSEYSWRALHGRAIALAASGKGPAALRDLLMAVEAMEGILADTDLRKGRGAFVDARFQLFNDAVRISLETGRRDAAFLFSERARGQIIRALELRDRLERLPPDRREGWLASRARFDGAREALAGRSRQRRSVPRAKLADFDAQTRRLEARAREAWSEMFADLDAAGPRRSFRLTDLDGLRAQLGPGDVVVTFHALDDEVVRWFRLDRAGVTVGSLSPMASPERVVGRASFVYLVPGFGVTLEAVTEGWVPRLIDRAPVSVLPLVASLTMPLGAADGPPLVVGDPELNLPAAQIEAVRVAEWAQATALIGEAATRQRVVSRLAGARLFHFAGHGALVAEDPWRAQLRLAAGGTLRLEDLWARPAAPGLAVLSGCETGRFAYLGRRLRVGLPEAFLFAGTQAVLATTRVVDDRLAAEFVDTFYREGGTERPFEAFRQTARDFSRKGKKGWTAFYIGGRRP